jgi:hypothetical protein
MYMLDLDFEIFPGKSFKGLCQDIYVRSEQKKDQLEILLSELRPFIKTIDDAVQCVPMIRDYLDVGVRNDEQLVKLAAIIQRLQAAKIEKGGGDLSLSEAEKDQLMKEVQEVAKETATPISASLAAR